MNDKSIDYAASVRFEPEKSGTLLRIEAGGRWTNSTVGEIASALDKKCRKPTFQKAIFDVSNISLIDSAGMSVILHYVSLLEVKGVSVEFEGEQGEFLKMKELVLRYAVSSDDKKPRLVERMLNPLEMLGRYAARGALDTVEFLSFLGESFVVLISSILHPLSVRYGAVAKNIQACGVSALPIIALTSFLIGVVIAYQGAVQLARFGGNIFVVDMIGISVTRELAPLITAIVVAGRTGSSYTAQLGVMKITEEMDAMRVMGFDPHRFLVQPRILALMIALPLLIFFSDIMGIAGGMFIADIHLNLSYAQFLNRLKDVLSVKHVWIGICKGPFFAWLIAVVGCFRGFQVSRNTESIGHYTTVSVVNSIFLVIACDALFSVLLTELGI